MARNTYLKRCGSDKMKKSPVLSIVVPTHNRSQYAIKCIEANLSIPSDEIELVITDTSTDHKLEEFLSRENHQLMDDARLVYKKINQPSNLTKNNNDAIALATGDYICLIGDDDCATDTAIEAASWAKKNNVDVISQTVSCNYAWPDFRSRLARAGHAGKMYVPRSIKAPTWRNTQTDLELALVNAFQGTDKMPRCYHGIVRRNLLNNIQHKTGDYFHGSSPDMSGAVSLACMIENYFEVDIPLTIPGASAGSNSGRSAMNTHKGSLSSESQTSSFEGADWSEGVPKFFSVETVWAHAGLQSLKKLKPELLEQYNFPRLLSLCRSRHSDYAEFIDSAEHEVQSLFGLAASQLSSQIKYENSKELRRVIWHYLKRGLIPTASGGRKNYKNLADISEALNALRSYIPGKKIIFEDYMASHN